MSGPLRRLEYTAIGDTTNTASRLEAMTKSDGGGMLVADATVRALMRDPPLPLELVGEVEVRGRDGKIRVWKLRADDARHA